MHIGSQITKIKPFLQKGSVILFDEFYGFPNWEKNEYKAFTEVFNEKDACEKLAKIIKEGKNFINHTEFIKNFCRQQGNQISSGKMASQFILSLLKSN